VGDPPRTFAVGRGVHLWGSGGVFPFGSLSEWGGSGLTTRKSKEGDALPIEGKGEGGGISVLTRRWTRMIADPTVEKRK